MFSNYANLLTAGQFNLLKSIAKEEPVKNPLSKEFIKTYNLGAASSVCSALKTLIEKELVIKEQNQYLVHEVLLSKWLQKLY